MILTTAKSSLGFSFFLKADVLLTEEPVNFTEYTQLMGRSDRTGPDEIKYGTLFSSKQALDQKSLEQTLKIKDRNLFLMHREQRESLLKLEEYVEKSDAVECKEQIQIALKGHNNGKTVREWKEQIHEYNKRMLMAERENLKNYEEEATSFKRQRLDMQ